MVQQTSGVKDLSSLVRYDSSLAAIRHVCTTTPKYTLPQRLVLIGKNHLNVTFSEKQEVDNVMMGLSLSNDEVIKRLLFSCCMSNTRHN